MPAFSLEPQSVPPVATKFRKIVTQLPAPESVPLLERLQAAEPRAMQGQPPVMWDQAEGFLVRDRWGNQWIDWSSGVLITNAGHNAPRVNEAIRKQVEHGLLTNYCFPSEVRLALVEKLASLLPEPLKKVFLLTTGSETVECAIKLCRTHGAKIGGTRKTVIVSFANAFHGRTLGSQQAGGIPALKQWIGHLDPGFVQLPFPDGFRQSRYQLRGLRKGVAGAWGRVRLRRWRHSRDLSRRRCGVRTGRVHAKLAEMVRPAQSAAGV